MRKRAASIEEIKESIRALAGRKLKISVNKGRKKIMRYEGELAGVYPGVFVLKLNGAGGGTQMSCTYGDVICGDIKLKAEP